MIKQTIFCDFCSKEFISDYWDEQPCKIELRLSGPAQQWESRKEEHVCRSCRKSIVKAWDELKNKLTNKNLREE